MFGGLAGRHQDGAPDNSWIKLHLTFHTPMMSLMVRIRLVRMTKSSCCVAYIESKFVHTHRLSRISGNFYIFFGRVKKLFRWSNNLVMGGGGQENN